jgi:Domain of unknown function (DUF4190)
MQPHPGQPIQQGGYQQPQPGQPMQAGYPQQQYAPAPPTSSKATPALVLGIVSLLCCPVICSILAIVFGKQAKDEIAANPGMQGQGQAQAGFILGIISLALAGLYLVAVLISAAAGA